MIDYLSIEKYKENNRIEAKRALGGLPKSIWETYSAFANTLGGVILLGVDELKDKSFNIVDLPDPQKLIDEFITLLNNKNKVSINILTKNNINIREIDGKKFIIISVPKAQRWEMPVYIDNEPFLNTYMRNGEGDYRLPKAQVEKLLKQAKESSFDMQASKYACDALNEETFETFNLLSGKNNIGGAIEPLLYKDNFLTTAALLVLGKYQIIKEALPHYKIVFNNTEIKENLFDFYIDTCRYLSAFNFGDEVIECFAEAIINAIINNNYFIEGEINVNLGVDKFEISNSGEFNINVNEAAEGGISAPRNPLIAKILSITFNTNRLGSGIPHMFKVWQKNNWTAPVFTQKDRNVTLTMFFDKKTVLKSNIPYHIYKDAIIEFITERVYASLDDIAQLLNITLDQAQQIMDLMPNLITPTKENPIIFKLKDR